MPNEFIKIGKYCRNYRMNVLELKLKDVEGNANIKTLSAFEHGKSTNIEHLLKYIHKCETHSLRVEFLEGLIKVIEDE